jgi:tRNA(fMet)-specific endonuclease VapC
LLILDTDHLSILRSRTQPSFDRLEARLVKSPDEVVTTIVTLQEQMQGWLAYLNNARLPAQVLLAYDELREMHLSFALLNLLPFDAAAQAAFVELRTTLRRLGTLDLRIAAIALTQGATLLSRNLRDFQQVPGLTVEDWTR